MKVLLTIGYTSTFGVNFLGFSLITFFITGILGGVTSDFRSESCSSACSEYWIEILFFYFLIQ